MFLQDSVQQISKCIFAAPEVHYLGHFISKHGVKVQPSKIDTVQSFPLPKNQRDLKSFFGLACNIWLKKKLTLFNHLLDFINC